VFEDFIFQDSIKTERVLSEYKSQRFSFWYAAGNLPDYIDATHAIFGHDPNVYYRKLSALLRSEFLREWLSSLTNPFNRRIGHLARLLSLLPAPILRSLSRPWWNFAQRIVLKRSLSILRGNVDTTLLNLPKDLAVDKLAVGHTHHNGSIEFKHGQVDKRYYCTSSPRWYVRGIKNDGLELQRNSGFVIIEPDARVKYFVANEEKRVPLHA